MLDSHFTLETLLFMLILFLYTISAPIFEKFKFHYMHESGMCMILGVIITLLLKLISPDVSNKHFDLIYSSRISLNL